MNVEPQAAGEPKTWVVLCTRSDGRSFPEYVEGAELTVSDGVITIRNGPELVRNYPVGSWLNYCEWITSTGFFDGVLIRGSASGAPQLPRPRPAAENHPLPSVSPQRSPLPPTARPVPGIRSGLPLPRG